MRRSPSVSAFTCPAAASKASITGSSSCSAAFRTSISKAIFCAPATRCFAARRRYEDIDRRQQLLRRSTGTKERKDIRAADAQRPIRGMA